MSYMAGFLTNYLLGSEACSNLSDNYIQSIIRDNSHPFLIGLQGTDLLSFNPHSLSKRGLSYRTAANTLRSQEYGAFFNNMMEYISGLEGSEHDVCIAYLAGFLCYYALNQSSAPYIMYRVWQDLPAKCSSSRMTAHRQNIEVVIDAILLRSRCHMEPSQLNFESLLYIGKRDQAYIARMMQHTIQTTYKYNISRSEITGGIRNIRRKNVNVKNGTRFKHNVRHALLRFLPVSSPRQSLYEDYMTDDNDYMNSEKKPWYAYPGCPEASNLSYEGIFEQALLNSHQLLEGLDSCLSWGMNRDEFINLIIRLRPY